MKNFVKEGRVVTVTAAGSVASGSVQIVSDMIGVAENAAESGDEYELALEGVYELALEAATATSVGDKVDWSGTDVVADTLGTAIGVALEDKSAGAGQTVKVRLHGAF